jgi:hypothetical protein
MGSIFTAEEMSHVSVLRKSGSSCYATGSGPSTASRHAALLKRDTVVPLRGGGSNVKKKLHGLSPRTNYEYTDRATAACRRSDCQLLLLEGATWSA